jgi:hypothetical protein
MMWCRRCDILIDAHHVLSVQLYTIYSVSVLYIVFSVFVCAVVGVVVLVDWAV